MIAIALPPASGRWTCAAKEELVLRLRRRELTVEEAVSRFRLSAPELLGWAERYHLYGIEGLKTTRLQGLPIASEDAMDVEREDFSDVGLDAEIACIKRELAMRTNVYPGWVRSGKMKTADAEREIRRMRAVLKRLLLAQAPA